MGNGCNLDFNSIKVRLEQHTARTLGTVEQFQFHKGTIRTALGHYDGEKVENFNSIKVRLERKQSKHIEP